MPASPSPSPPSPRHSVPIPQPTTSHASRKKSKSNVLQSSLEIVFSYSRSQQNRYGAIHTAPSFVDAPSSRSWSSPEHPRSGGSQRRRRQRDLEIGDEEEAGRASGKGQDGSHGSSPDDPGPEDEDADADLDEEDEEEEESNDPDLDHDIERRRSSAGQSIFPADPVKLSPAYSGDEGGGNAPTLPASGSGGGPAETNHTGKASVPNNTTSASGRQISPSTSVTTPRSNLLSLVRTSSNYVPTASTRTSPVSNQRNQAEALAQAEDNDRRFVVGAEATSPGTETTPLLSTTGRAKPYSFDDHEGQAGMANARRRSSVGMTSHGGRRVSGYGAGGKRRLSGVRRRRRPPDVGQSTDGQTLFNAVAVLVGIGILSLPLAFAYAGWIGGTIMLLGFGYLTCHTAKLLARLILSDRSLHGYTDIGSRAFGGWASSAINILFCLELFALGVALIVLFGDSLEAIFPEISADTFKLIGFFIVVPTTLLPLSILSLPSLLSTLSSLLLVLIILIDGFSKSTSPGSLLHPEPTNFGPEWTHGNWLGGIGLILAGFGGHAVVPGLARDMKHPEHFDRVINKAFLIAVAISFVAGAAGYLMIGNDVSDEITRDLLQSKYGYPRALNLVALWMIVVNPITKFGLCSRPLNVTIETLLGISPATPGDESQIFTSGLSRIAEQEHAQVNEDGDDEPSPTSISDNHLDIGPRVKSPPPLSPSSSHSHHDHQASNISNISIYRNATERRKVVYRVISRIIVTAICTATAIGLPGFGRVMAFLGSFSAFLICIILPLLFYLRLSPILFPEDDPPFQRTIHWCLVCGGVVLMVAGTVWAFLPDSGHGEVVEG